MTGDNLDLEVKVEPAPAVVVHVLARKVYRYLHRHRYGIVDEHEPLQGLMTLLVIGGRGQCKSRQTSRMVLLPRHRRTDLCRKF